MIKAINYGLAVSDEGFEIRMGRDHLSYIEGDYAIRIRRHIEEPNTPHTVSYDFEELGAWYPPHEKEPITPEQKIMIMERVEDGLRVLLNQGGYEYEIKRSGNTIISIQKPLDPIQMVKANQRKIKETRAKLPK